MFQIKEIVNSIYENIITSKTSLTYELDKLLRLSSMLVDGDKYIRRSVLHMISLGDYNVLSKPGIKKDILTEGHLFWFHNKGDNLTKIMSAKWLLENSDNYSNREVKLFIKKNIKDPVIGMMCIDLVKKYKIENIEEEGKVNIQEEFENRNKISKIEEKINEKLKGDKREIYLVRRTIYDDGQNVHNSSINNSVKDIIVKLHNDFGRMLSYSDKYLNDIKNSMKIISFNSDIINEVKINGSITRITTDPSTFTNLNLKLKDILCLVWLKIQKHKDKEELKKRLWEELIDMNGMCATGHLSRLINVLSGFFEDIQIKADYKDQIKVYLTNHYNKIMAEDPEMENLINEITELDINNKKNVLKFVDTHGIRNRLYKEYKDLPGVSLEKFNEWYDNAKNAYAGVVSRL